MLSPGDLIIDGGNSEYLDTNRRCSELRKKGLYFIGTGVSGGEEGARYGPSLMPGGHLEAWPLIKEIFQAISAKVSNEPCCDWVGDGGSGHFVKMVHNGIEYGDMQLICEAYHIMRSLGMSPMEMSKQFLQWNNEELNSFLIEITANILKYQDENGFLLERIRDAAGQKGTGKWTVSSALQYGVSVTLISEAVFSRFLSALKDERVVASHCLPKSDLNIQVNDLKEFLQHLKYALYCAKIVSYAQGFMLLREAAKANNWDLNYGAIALMWRGGCIIRR